MFLLCSCGENGKENTETDARWSERESAFQDLVRTDQKDAMDFSSQGDIAAPQLRAEKTDEEILKEPLRAGVLGVMGPESGELSDYGKKTLNGVTMALEEVNQAGGVKGRQVELFHKDSSSSMAGTLKATDAMIQKNVLAIIGSPTGEITFSATKPLNDSRTILFSAGTRRRIGTTGIYHFRNTQEDKSASADLIRYCIEEKGLKDFAMFTSMVNDFSIELSAYIKNTLMLQGASLPSELFLWPETTTYITEEQSSINAQVRKLKEGKIPEAFIFTGDLEEGMKVLKVLREEGITIPFVCGEDLVTDKFLQEAGKMALGTIAFSGFDPDSQEPHILKFVADYKKRYGEKPDRIAALAYDAANIVLMAAEKAPSWRTGDLRKAILNTRDFRGVTGITTFTESGEVVKQPTIFEVKEKGGKPEFVAVTGYR
jgi:branched-chain amino acid transport system substrate-binding protein